MKTRILFSLVIFSLTITTFSFTHKKVIQSPIAVLDHPNVKSNQAVTLNAEEFKKSKGVTVLTTKSYEVTGFSVVRVPKGGDPVEMSNWSGSFGQRTIKLIELATSGDTYYFDNVMAKLPTMLSEDEWIKLNNFVVKIE